MYCPLFCCNLCCCAISLSHVDMSHTNWRRHKLWGIKITTRWQMTQRSCQWLTLAKDHPLKSFAREIFQKITLSSFFSWLRSMEDYLGEFLVQATFSSMTHFLHSYRLVAWSVAKRCVCSSNLHASVDVILSTIMGFHHLMYSHILKSLSHWDA